MPSASGNTISEPAPAPAPPPPPPPPLSPVLVSVSITGTRRNAAVNYTYIDPTTGKKITSPTCTLLAIEPYDALFTLDPASQEAGWTFVSAVNKPGARVPSYELSNDRSSLMTFATTMQGWYQFSLFFVNANGSPTYSDPQEGNSGPGEDPH